MAMPQVEEHVWNVSAWTSNFQTKEHDKTPEQQLSEMEIGNLYEEDFRIIIISMIQDLGGKKEAQIEKLQEMLNKEEDSKNRGEQYDT